MKGAILAVDPGPTHSAWVVLDPSGAVAAHAKEGNEVVRDRMRCMSGDITSFMHLFPTRGLDDEDCAYIEGVAIEMVQSFGMAVGAEVFETVRWVGRFQELCSDLPTRLVYRKEVKLHLCNSMKARDQNIRQALIDKLGPVGKKSAPGPCYRIAGDVWSALAVAIVARETVWAP